MENEYKEHREELVRGGVKSEVPLGWLFMEKIVQLPIFLPSPTKAGWDSYIADLIEANDKPGSNASANKGNDAADNDKKRISELNLNPA